ARGGFRPWPPPRTKSDMPALLLHHAPSRPAQEGVLSLAKANVKRIHSFGQPRNGCNDSRLCHSQMCDRVGTECAGTALGNSASVFPSRGSDVGMAFGFGAGWSRRDLVRRPLCPHRVRIGALEGTAAPLTGAHSSSSSF